MPSVLIVDDEANIRRSLEGALGREGFQADSAASVAEGRTKLRDAYDFVLLDVWDFLEKPISLERLLILLRNAGTTLALRNENRRLKQPWMHPIVGTSPSVQALLREIQLAGQSAARVLIQGENGTGKELVARALHASGARRERAFVAVNCSAIPEELIESELFGHERGAFTGATQARRGRFEEAHGGTLFLDEVGDLSPRAQTKLLRVLEEAEFFRVGGNRTIRVDVRVIAATNRDLAERIRSNQFREDLYFRLAVIPITVPPLRERSEDVALLLEHFAAQIARETNGKQKRFTPGALDLLRRYPFPGNVRELRNLVERLIIMTPGPTVDQEQVHAVLPRPEGTATERPRLSEAVREFEKKQIEAALLAEGTMTKAATRLGLERSHLYKKMKRLGWRPESLEP